MTDLTTLFSLWGAFLSTLLGTVKLWEFLNADKLHLDTTYVFRSHDKLDDEIVVSNLSPKPIQVADWSLEWEPKWFSGKDSIAVTIEDDTLRVLSISGYSTIKLTFSNDEKVPSSQKVSSGRKLVLKLKCFGRKKPVNLIVSK